MKKICLLLAFLSIGLCANADRLGSGLPGYSSAGMGSGTPGRYGSQSVYSQSTYSRPTSSYNDSYYQPKTYSSPITSQFRENNSYSPSYRRNSYRY